ncbi:MAG TPA: GDSL-type esterase/lipase family protein, partial [Pyrinomonadaceae bacterium]|nr:GDSL-type esterase/lipase family protein [Pyrinomonadaceae bacterium]
MVCKVCGAQLRGAAKFCHKCGVPLSIFSRLGSKFLDSKSEMTVVAGQRPIGVDEDEVPTVDSPARLAPTVESPAVPPPAEKAPEPLPKQPRHILLSKPAQTILFVFIFASLPLFIPSLAGMLGMKDQPYSDLLPDPHELVTFKSSGGSSADTGIPGGGPSTGETTISATGTDAPVIVGSEHPIEDPARALDSFYASLARTEARQPGAITRVTHYGDSPITNDGITSTVRRLLQVHFGDAGHGFILIDRPWAWYGHDAINFTSGGGWDDDPMGPASSADEFGLGGVSFRASGPGKYARFAPASAGETGKNFSRMEVYYLSEPGGGQFSVSVNNENSQTISTTSDQLASGFYEIRATRPGENTFEVKSAGGSVRLFGAVIENEGPGVVYDSLGVNGAYAGLLVSAMNEGHWAEQLRHRSPNLVIINYGTNESQYASVDQMQRYEKDLHEVIRRVRTALPQVAILVVSPMDRGKRVPGGKIVTLPSIPMIVEMQRRVALEENCAFFNTFQAMGGEGTMAKWAAGKGKDHLVGGDLTHPTAEGSEIVGRLIYEAINDGYTKY